MKIKHWIIPNKHNKFHPHALRPVGLLVALSVLVLIQPLYNAVTARTFQVLGYATSISVSELNNISNSYRANNGLSGLGLNAKLNNAAMAKAQDMFADNYWAHTAPDGTTGWSFISAAGYNYTVAGENLAKGFYTSDAVIDGWMASPTHRDNVLNSQYKEVGYAVVDGVLLGDEVTLVVALYGTEYVPPVTQKTAEPAAPVAAQPTPLSVEPESTNPATTTIQPAIAPEAATDATIDNQKSDNTDMEANNSGEVLGSAYLYPIKAYQSLNWGQKASILIVCTLILLFIMKHTLIWRQQRRGLKHIWLRSHPIGQAAMLTSVLILTLASGTGVVL